MIVRGAQKSRASVAPLDARVQDVAGTDFEHGGVERLARVVVEHKHVTAELVVLERLDDVGRVLDRDRRAFFGDLQIVAAVGIALDALAEEGRDARVVDPFVVAVPIAVAARRNLPRFDGIETSSRHYRLFLTFHFSRLSRMIVTGPSLTRSTSIMAPNSPVSTLTSCLRAS